MAGNAFDVEDDDVIAQINVIPFVDIVLVLLIIFLLTANIIAKQSIRVDLPKAANASETVGPAVNVVITSSGDLFVDGHPADLRDMTSQVAREHGSDSRLRAVIAADRTVSYDRVIQVIDAIKQAGVTAFALDVERPGHG
jgi:biopolymer transport protein TolR